MTRSLSLRKKSINTGTPSLEPNLIPFLSDKRYSNEEINKIFNFTNDELNLIDFTLNKFNYNSPWFKRYMCGKNGATDEEVTEYIKKITEEC